MRKALLNTRTTYRKRQTNRSQWNDCDGR